MTRGLTAPDLLRVWERGRDRHPIDRALVILAYAQPDLPDAELAALPIGERDKRLFAARAATLGGRVEALADCPRCGSTTELSFSAGEVIAEDSAPGGDFNPPQALEIDGIHLVLHRPDSRDLAAIATAANVEEARGLLLRRCVLAASRGEQAIEPEALTPTVQANISVRLADADPNADLELDVQCDTCGHAWLIPFDIAVFFWMEIEARVAALAREVTALARAFGWREGDILAMSAARRRLYLEMGA